MMVREQIKRDFDKIKDLIQEESLKTLFEIDVLAIERLQASIKRAEVLMDKISKHPTCFDRQDVDNVQRMRRVLAREHEWRIKRLRTAVAEYDNKIIKMIALMKEREKILTEDQGLYDDDLLEPLNQFFSQKRAQLEEYNQKLKDRMRELLQKPIKVDIQKDTDEPKEDRDWRNTVRHKLNPHDPFEDDPEPIRPKPVQKKIVVRHRRRFHESDSDDSDDSYDSE